MRTMLRSLEVSAPLALPQQGAGAWWGLESWTIMNCFSPSPVTNICYCILYFCSFLWVWMLSYEVPLSRPLIPGTHRCSSHLWISSLACIKPLVSIQRLWEDTPCCEVQHGSHLLGFTILFPFLSTVTLQAHLFLHLKMLKITFYD